MRTVVENYRGWDISFDTDKECFYSTSDWYDQQQEKQSFSAAKKWVDEFLKENQKFKPFYVEKCPEKYYGGRDKIKIIGIRKDGAFVYEGKDGEKKQLSKYDEKEYMLINEENEQYWKELDNLEKEREAIRQKEKAVNGKFIVSSLKDYKSKLLGTPTEK